jgi:hypothetical protein
MRALYNRIGFGSVEQGLHKKIVQPLMGWTIFFGDLDRGEPEPNKARTGSYVEDSKRGKAVDACYCLSVSD